MMNRKSYTESHYFFPVLALFINFSKDSTATIEVPSSRIFFVNIHVHFEAFCHIRTSECI